MRRSWFCRGTISLLHPLQQLLQGMKTWLFFLRVALMKPRLLHPVVPELGKKEKCPLPRTENPGPLAASSSLKSGMKYLWLLMLVSFTFYLHINTRNLDILRSNVAVVLVFNHLCTNVFIRFQKKYQKWRKLTESLVSERNTALRVCTVSSICLKGLFPVTLLRW